MKVVALTLAVALLGLGAACSDAAGEESAELDETCHGQPSPVDEEEIVRVLGRYGFELFREDYCWGLAGANAPAAMYTNMPASMTEATAASSGRPTARSGATSTAATGSARRCAAGGRTRKARFSFGC